MANKQVEIYQNYVKGFDHIVKPVILEQWPVMAEGETMEKTDWTRRVGESYSTRVYKTSLGRVFEVEPINRGWSNLFHIFETKQDWFNFKKPMGMFHYLNT